MRTQPINKSSNFRFAKASQHSDKDTAYHIFHKDARHSYEIDYAHFRAMNNNLNQPIIGRYSETEMYSMSSSMMPTAGCIWDIVTQFIDGATIRFSNPKTPVLIYRAIVKHIDAHLLAMRTIKMYDSPDPEDFRQMSEFAVAIRPQAMLEDTDIDDKKRQSFSQTYLPVRASFSQRTVAEEQSKAPDVPKVVEKMDCIDKYLESINGR
jgi:hypothetical protein